MDRLDKQMMQEIGIAKHATGSNPLRNFTVHLRRLYRIVAVLVLELIARSIEGHSVAMLSHW